MTPSKAGFIEAISEEWQSVSGRVLILSNLVPAAGVLFFGWTVYSVVFLYWAENVVIGVFQALRMALASGPFVLPRSKKIPAAPEGAVVPAVIPTGGGFGTALKAFLIPFFCVHYGGFCFVHGLFVTGLFGGGFRKGTSPAAGWKVPEEIGAALIALVAAHAFFFLKDYLIGGEYRSASPVALMQEPYGRIVVLHVFIIGSAFLIMAFGVPLQALVALVFAKTAWDCRSQARRRGAVAEPAALPA